METQATINVNVVRHLSVPILMTSLVVTLSLYGSISTITTIANIKSYLESLISAGSMGQSLLPH